jgi:hypothetical protein
MIDDTHTVLRLTVPGGARGVWVRVGAAIAMGALLALTLGACAQRSERPAPAPPQVSTPTPPAQTETSPPPDPSVRGVLGRAETAAAMGYSAGHGVVVRVERVWIEPVAAKPGDRLTLRARLAALAPREDSTIPVRERWNVLFAGLPLTSLSARDLTLRQGTSEIESSFVLPPDAADGEYSAELVVGLLGTADLRESKDASPFTVTAVRAPERPRPSPPAPPPTRMVRIKVESVDVRSGPGATSRARARIPRDSAVELLEDRQVGGERWYRVRLANGDEGWIPATTATSPDR